MANNLLIFFFLLILASHHVIQGASKSSRTSFIVPSRRESHFQGGSGGGKRWVDKNPRRLVLSPNPENLHLSLPWSLNKGGKPREVSQRSTGSLKNPMRLELMDNPNSKNSHLFLPGNCLNRGGKLRDVSQQPTGSLESPRIFGLNNPNSKNSHLSLSSSINQGGKLRDLSSGPLENPRRLGLDPNPKNPRRMMIGSVAPTCTYNECKGCKYKCRAEQVPVEGNDPINSPYHYKCVCHR